MTTVLGAVTPHALAIALSPFGVIVAILMLFTPPPPAGAFLIGWAVGIAAATGVFVALASVIELSDEPALARLPLAGPPPTPLARFGGILRRSTVTDFVLRRGVPPHFGPWTVIARLAREGHCPLGDPSPGRCRPGTVHCTTPRQGVRSCRNRLPCPTSRS